MKGCLHCSMHARLVCMGGWLTNILYMSVWLICLDARLTCRYILLLSIQVCMRGWMTSRHGNMHQSMTTNTQLKAQSRIASAYWQKHFETNDIVTTLTTRDTKSLDGSHRRSSSALSQTVSFDHLWMHNANQLHCTTVQKYPYSRILAAWISLVKLAYLPSLRH